MIAFRLLSRISSISLACKERHQLDDNSVRNDSGLIKRKCSFRNSFCFFNRVSDIAEMSVALQLSAEYYCPSFGIARIDPIYLSSDVSRFNNQFDVLFLFCDHIYEELIGYCIPGVLSWVGAFFIPPFIWTSPDWGKQRDPKTGLPRYQESTMCVYHSSMLPQPLQSSRHCVGFRFATSSFSDPPPLHFTRRHWTFLPLQSFILGADLAASKHNTFSTLSSIEHQRRVSWREKGLHQFNPYMWAKFI